MPSVRLQFIIDCRSKSAFGIRLFHFINDQNTTTLRTRLICDNPSENHISFKLGKLSYQEKKILIFMRFSISS